MSITPIRLAAVETFKHLNAADLALLEGRLEPMSVHCGSILIRQGETADTLYVVVSGRFAVEIEGQGAPVAEIAAGSPIGEIAFFAGGTRTASVRAIRDSVVVALTKEDFEEISRRAPAIWQPIAATLADRLAAETRKSNLMRRATAISPRARTIAIVHAGDGPVPQAFQTGFETASRARAATLVLSSSSIKDYIPCGDVDTLDATRILNDLESRYDTIVFVADGELNAWTRKAIRQADEILFLAHVEGPVGSAVPLNELEEFALSLEHKPRGRLVLVHQSQSGVQGTRHWLAGRAIHMHHHVVAGSQSDIARIWRFIAGEALGFVACGGGAFCASHVGIYKAFKESGIDFDLLVGTSGGAAMAAAFAQGIDPADIDNRIHRMFIEGRAMQRYTLPRYSLLDHKHFDSHLAAEYGNTLIEDIWKPYFAVSMDLADYNVEVHSSGPVWAAIRASAAIPALLPPFYTPDGRMLVDGSVISNVPIDVMHRIKSGPNVVVTFSEPKGDRFAIDYATLPARNELVWKSLNPWGRDDLPDAPSAATVLIRCLMANRNHFERHLEAGDWLLMPPTPPEMGALDWRRHSELVEAAYRYALAEIARRNAAVP